MKGFIMAVIAGVVAAAVYKTVTQKPLTTTSPALGVMSQAPVDPNTGQALGIDVYDSIPAPSGHGDATQNVTGTPVSTVDPGIYAPPVDTDYN